MHVVDDEDTAVAVGATAAHDARRLLYQDAELGAGNFLFKAHAASPTRGVPFLFLEKPFTDPGGTVHAEFSLESLRGAVKAVARWYAAHGIRRGMHVCTYLANGIPQFVHYLALNSLGAVPVLINCRMPPAIASLYASENGFGVFVTDEETRAGGVAALLPPGMAQLFTGDDLQGLPAEPALPEPWPVAKADRDVVMVSHSSGTTAVPKATLFEHAQFFIGKRERLLRFQERADDRMLAGMPPSHSAGISYLMTATLLELPTFVLSELAGPALPGHIARERPAIMTGFPQTWVSLAQADLPAGAFPTLRRFYNTGDSAHEAHIARLLELAPDARFMDGFGASELGMALFQKTSTAGAVASRRCVGRPVPFAEAAIVDTRGKPLPDGEVGYFALKSPTITPGYYGQPQLTQLCRLGAWWLTGDVGYRAGDGEYYQVDRGVDVVQTPFGPLYSLVTEEILQGLAGVHDAVVVGADRSPMKIHSTIAIVTPRPGHAVSAEAVLRRLRGLEMFRGDLPDWCLCAAVLADDSAIPTGATGKVLKRTVRESFWSLHRNYVAADRSVFTELRWNTQ
ncbi:MAG: class I adenylate-forming enzyme family protein [Pseudomonadota bacterium]